MDLGLAYDLQTDPLDPRQAEFDPPCVIDAVCAALQALGHTVCRLGSAADILSASERLATVELVFNIAEGAGGRCREAVLPAMLDRFGVPYVGSGPTALALALDKAVTKKIALASGVPTPSWCVASRAADVPDPLPSAFPLIVKPRYEGSGIGIEPAAVVSDRAALLARVEQMTTRWHQPVLIEAFVPDGELTVCVIGNDPPVALPAIQRPLDPVSRLACHVAPGSEAAWQAPLALTEALDAEAGRLAVAMFEALGCCDMARVDFRVDAAGCPLFLEINPLPTFDPEGSLGLLAELQGVPFAAMIGRILDAAVARVSRAATPAIR